MKSIIVLCFLALVSVTVAGPPKYTARFDNINIEQFLMNRRLLVGYILCVLDKGKCTHDGRELKSHVKEAFENDCGKCTEVQRTKTRIVIKHLINNERDLWNQLIVKYDPQEKYVKKFEEELKTIKT